MKSANLRTYLVLAVLSLVLMACKPWADFSFSPKPVVAGVETTFDASASMVNLKGNAGATYAWNFGDGTAAGSGKIIKHTFARVGEYHVKLSVTNDKGEVGTVVKEVHVKAPSAATTSLKIQVQGSDGALITAAKVDVGTLTAQTDAQGQATVANVDVGTTEQVITVSKVGYVPQSLLVALVAGKTANALAILKPVKEIRHIAQAEIAQVIAAQTLGASVSLPANALVAPDNTPATGAITLQLTPWDITSRDLNGMLGNGRARGADGQLTDLISAGMMTVDFYDAQNRHLQLAAGKTADIQMDLPYASINGQALTAGSTIPLWHFDPAQGLWVEQGTGSVVYSNTSPVLLAVKATVSHFSTWNWDFKFQNAGTVNVSCVDSTGQLSACNINAVVTMPDGSIFTRSNAIGAEVLTVINMPSTGSIEWTANNNGSVGAAASGTTGNVVIELGAPKTSHFVQCALTDTSKVACQVTQSFTKADGTPFSQSLRIPAEGAWVKTGYQPASVITWDALSDYSVNASGQYTSNVGTASSAATGTVAISLATTTTYAEKTVQLTCAGTAQMFSGAIEAVTSCTVAVQVCTGNVCPLYQTITMAPNVVTTVSLPYFTPGANVYLGASGTTASGLALLRSQSFNLTLGALTVNQLFTFVLQEWVMPQW